MSIEYIAINQVVFDTTPKDIDGKILYKVTFSYKHYNEDPIIRVFKITTSYTEPIPQEEEIIGQKKEDILDYLKQREEHYNPIFKTTYNRFNNKATGQL